MKVFEIYTDNKCSVPASKSLIEGHQYYISINLATSAERERFVIENNLAGIVQIMPDSKIGTLKFDKKVGEFKINNVLFDISSKHFLPGNSGKAQLNYLLDDIRNISKGLSFQFSGLTHTNGSIDREDKSPTLLEKFNYYRQLVLELPIGHNLSSLVDEIMRNPKQRIIIDSHLTDINRIKAFKPNSLKNIVNPKSFVPIQPGSALANSVLGGIIRSHTSKDLFPFSFITYRTSFSLDNPENRFVKFVIHEISLISSYILSQKLENSFINYSANEMLNIVNKLLSNPFFISVGKLNNIPTSSTVLFNRMGYRELYQHYINSRFGIRNVINSFEANNINSNLKNIATLYEIWLFYKLGSILFKNNITVSIGDRIFKDGNIYYGFKWEDDKYILSYNLSYSKSNNLSYSLLMRPDFTLVSKSKPNDLFIFDAKYKGRDVKTGGDEIEPELAKYFTSEDLHKMHCYLDTIDGSKISVILYPGDYFRFFEKSYGLDNIKNKPSEISKLHGVGAIPVSPLINSNLLEDFIHLIA